MWAGKAVDVATRYELDGPGIGSRRGRDFFAPVQPGPGAHSASCTMGTSTPPLFVCGSLQGGPLLLYFGIHEKCPLFLSDFNQTFILSTHFSMNDLHNFSRKSIWWEPSYLL